MPSSILTKLKDVRCRVERLMHGARPDPATQRFIDFNARKWRRDYPVKKDSVVLVGHFAWKPLICCYSHAVNAIARKTQSSIEAFSFAPKLDPVLEKTFASFGARLGLSWKDARPFEAQAARLAEEIFGNVETKWDVVNIAVDGVVIGDLIYDTYLRHLACSTVDLADPRLKAFLREGLLIYLTCKDYLARRKPAAIIPDHIVYNQCGILVRLAAIARIPVFMAYYDPEFYLDRLVTTREDGGVQFPIRSPFWKFPELFNGLDPAEKEAAIANARQALESRFSGSIDHTVLPGRSAYEPADLSKRVLRDSGKPRVLILLHDFCDAAHIHRSLLFPDFYEWLHFLLLRARETPFDWYVKPHPNNSDPGRAAMNATNNSTVDAFRREFPEVTFLDPSVSNKQLVAEGINAMFTVYGTAGHEYAYMGVPVVNAGDNPHIAYAFNLHPQSVEEYASYIDRADQLEVPISKRDIEEYFYMNYYYYPEKLGSRVQLLDLALARRADANQPRIFDAFISGANTGSDTAFTAYIDGLLAQ